VEPRDGELRVEGKPPLLVVGPAVRFALTPGVAHGLQAVNVEWGGSSPLVVRGIEIRSAVVP